MPAKIWRSRLWRSSSGSVVAPTWHGVLDDDGVLYLARALSGGDENVETLAIQTQSPGLAESSWPSLRHDNRGTMWLTPLPPLETVDEPTDGAVAGGIDAALDAPLE
jgi:hypothetical protein